MLSHGVPDQVLQKTIRCVMNELMGIEHDRDIVGLPLPPQDALDWYEEDRSGPGPSIHPMRPCWDSLGSEWNGELSDLFLARLKRAPPDGLGVTMTDSDRIEAQKMFYERLHHLKREIAAAGPKPGERPCNTQERLLHTKKLVSGRQRPISRRNQVSLSKGMAGRLEVFTNQLVAVP